MFIKNVICNSCNAVHFFVYDPGTNSFGSASISFSQMKPCAQGRIKERIECGCGSVFNAVVESGTKGERKMAVTAIYSWEFNKHADKDNFAQLLCRLGKQELNVAKLAAKGLGNSAIAAELGIALNTVKGHMNSVAEKLGITSRAVLVEHYDVVQAAKYVTKKRKK